MSENVRHVEDGIALLSLHEVTPAFEDDVVKMLDLLEEMGVGSLTLLVTPFYGLKRVNTFEKSPTFAEYLLSLGHELSLHGYTHVSITGSADEFTGLSPAKVNSRMMFAINMFENAFGKRPVGTVPPRWTAPADLCRISARLNLRYTTIGNDIHLHPSGRTVTTAQLIVSRGKRILDLSKAVMEMELGGALQVALHPVDHRHKHVIDLLNDMTDRLNYRFMGYWEYLRSLV